MHFRIYTVLLYGVQNVAHILYAAGVTIAICLLLQQLLQVPGETSISSRARIRNGAAAAGGGEGLKIIAHAII